MFVVGEFVVICDKNPQNPQTPVEINRLSQAIGAQPHCPTPLFAAGEKGKERKSWLHYLINSVTYRTLHGQWHEELFKIAITTPLTDDIATLVISYPCQVTPTRELGCFKLTNKDIHPLKLFITMLSNFMVSLSGTRILTFTV